MATPSDHSSSSITGRSFAVRRKGFDPDEVRAYLGQLAEVVSRLTSERDSAKANLHDLEVAARDRPAIDEEQLTAALGEETASVLTAARKAATEIKERAEENVARMLREAAEEAGTTRREADETAARQRETADRLRAEAEEIRRQAAVDAAAEAERIRTEANEAADAVRAEAEEVRAAALAEAAEVRNEAEADGARVRAEAEEVLGVKTAEAIEAADAIRAQGEADAQASRDAGEADAAASREQGEADREAAREEGREMVAEATRVRERMLADLSRRRKTARVQLEQLQAARDRLLDSYAAVQRTMDEATSGLRTALVDARTAAEGARIRAEAEPEATVAQLESQITAARSAGLPLVAPDDPRDEETTTDDEGEDEADEPTGEPVVDLTDGGPEPSADDADVVAEAAEAQVSDAPDQADQEPSEPAEMAAEAAAEPETPAPEPETEEGEVTADGAAPGGDGVGAEPTEDVDELFARLRAERPETDPAAAEAAEAEVVGAAADDDDASPDADDGDASPDADVAADAAAEVEDEVEDDDEVVDLELISLLERRDGAVEPIEGRIARKLKRALADEQGAVLDLVRRERGRVDLASALPADDQLSAYTTVVTEELVTAAEEGAGFEGATLPSSVTVDDLAADLARDLAAVVRPRVERCFEAGDDPDDTSDRLRATYREWKTDRLVEVTRHHVLAAFGRGQAAVRPVGEPVRWVPDPTSPACPDCEDDALAGTVPSGEPFPTGHLHPPAHPGCRCLLIAVRVATPA